MIHHPIVLCLTNSILCLLDRLFRRCRRGAFADVVWADGCVIVVLLSEPWRPELYDYPYCTYALSRTPLSPTGRTANLTFLPLPLFNCCYVLVLGSIESRMEQDNARADSTNTVLVVLRRETGRVVLQDESQASAEFFASSQLRQ
jgi:hypothetical protein